MKKLNKFLALLISITSTFITRTFAIINAGDEGVLWGSIVALPVVRIPDNISLVLKFFILPFLVLMIIWDLIIWPYRYYKFYKKLSVEEKQRVYPILKIERHIFYGLICLMSVVFFLLILSFSNQIGDFEDIRNLYFVFFICCALVHYIFNLLYGVKVFISKDKLFGKKIIIGIQFFLIIFYGVSVGLNYLLNQIFY